MDDIDRIAARLTDDPDMTINEEHGSYTADELQVPVKLLPAEYQPSPPSSEIIPDISGSDYEGLPVGDTFVSNNLVVVEFDFEWTYYAEERRTYEDPGSPAYAEIYDPVVANIIGEHGKIALTPELEKWLVGWFDDNHDKVIEYIDIDEGFGQRHYR